MERTLAPEFETELKNLLEAINFKYGFDFRQYSITSVKRTLIHAMNRMGCQTIAILEKKILQDPESFQSLIQSLTISVSELFRDPSYFLSLRLKVMPLLRTYPSLKVWVAGCSTGEEVYSLAILLQEEELLDRAILYATDINSRSLKVAEKGVFGLDEMQSASQSYKNSGGVRKLSDYYTVEGRSVSFNSDLKKNITFAHHSLVTDAVFAETHLISCRNVLIYFNRQLQDRAFGLFNESLCRKCFLGLGSKETLYFSQYAKYFESLVKVDRIFKKI